MTLHVGLGSTCCKNLIRILSRYLSGGNSLEWIASTTCCGSFNLSPNSYDLFCAGSSSSNTSTASSGVSVSFTAGAASASNMITHNNTVLDNKSYLPSVIRAGRLCECVGRRSGREDKKRVGHVNKAMRIQIIMYCSTAGPVRGY